MYKIELTKKAHRDIKKLGKQAITKIDACFEILEHSPHKGEKLKGVLKDYWKYKFSVTGISYRIVYQIFKKQLIVLIVMIGNRENFYKQLLKRL